MGAGRRRDRPFANSSRTARLDSNSLSIMLRANRQVLAKMRDNAAKLSDKSQEQIESLREASELRDLVNTSLKKLQL